MYVKSELNTKLLIWGLPFSCCCYHVRSLTSNVDEVRYVLFLS
jgi:hypothetical protein